MDALKCRKRANQFCFCCARYVTGKNRVVFSDKIQNKYKSTFNLKKIKNVDENFTPNIICRNCEQKVRAGKDKRNNLKSPAIWNTPNANHNNCFLCQTNMTLLDMKRSLSRNSKKNKPYVYREDLSVILPVTFKQAESKAADPQSNKKHSEMDTNNKMESNDEE